MEEVVKSMYDNRAPWNRLSRVFLKHTVQRNVLQRTCLSFCAVPLCCVDMVWLGVVTFVKGENVVALGQRCLLNNVTGKQELDMSWWNICSGMNRVQIRRNDITGLESRDSLDQELWKAHQIFEEDKNV